MNSINQINKLELLTRFYIEIEMPAILDVSCCVNNIGIFTQSTTGGRRPAYHYSKLYVRFLARILERSAELASVSVADWDWNLVGFGFSYRSLLRSAEVTMEKWLQFRYYYNDIACMIYVIICRCFRYFSLPKNTDISFHVTGTTKKHYRAPDAHKLLRSTLKDRTGLLEQRVMEVLNHLCATMLNAP